MLCAAGNSSYCHSKVLLGSKVNSLCPSSYFRHRVASVEQLCVDLNHMNVFESLNYKPGNFLFRVTEEVLAAGWGNTHLLSKLP